MEPVKLAQTLKALSHRKRLELYLEVARCNESDFRVTNSTVLKSAIK